MFTTNPRIEKTQSVAEIVTRDYRTADVFRKYGIEYCCGGRAPLQMACVIRGIDEDKLISELEDCMREVNPSNTLDFNAWHIDFLTDYIVNVHHHYLRIALPSVQDHVDRFVNGHREKFTYLNELQHLVSRLRQELIPHMVQEEDIIFPYIRQIGHAYYSRESYASLLVRTLRKPVEHIMQQEHESAGRILRRMRELTHDYTPPSDACLSHKVTFMKLKEVDADIVRHLHLENNILFPKAINMEKELLNV